MPIATPPFYCGLIRGALEGLYSGGVKTDRTFHVKLPGRDKAFENLFAIGADGGMLYNFVYGLDINGSMSCHGVNSARTAANLSHELVAAATNALPTPSVTNANTVVKTVVNQLSVAQDLNITAEESPCTCEKGDARFDAFYAEIEQLTGETIDAMKMVVKVTESQGAEIAATHEIPIVYNYTLVSLEGTVSGNAVSYQG